MFQNRYLFILYFLLGILYSQPKFSIGIDVGYYQPDIPVSGTNQLPASSGFSKDILPGFSLSYNFFPGARIGFAHSFSYQSDKTKSGTPFSRILSYRMFLIETYYFSKERLEWNFSLGPIWNKGSIKIDTEVNVSEWDNVLTGFNDGDVSIAAVNSDKMTTNWFGFASFIGLRYYVRSWWAIDIKTGYLTNYYDHESWKFQGKTVTGPVMNIDGLPILTVKVIFGW